jgi:hypothetical protein
MHTSPFPPGFDSDIETLAIDFDGVIHNYDKGFHDGTCYGEPLNGSLEAVKKLSSKYKIVIYTAKARPDRPLVNGKTGVEHVQEWLEKYEIMKYIHEITAIKPRALIYIDDNCYRFNNWADTLDYLNNEL